MQEYSKLKNFTLTESDGNKILQNAINDYMVKYILVKEITGIPIIEM